MIFRWSLWGLHKTESVELLRYSILSFKSRFGENNRYIVFTDEVEFLRDKIGNIAKVIYFNENGKSIFDIESKATWKKWCPRVKLELDETEIYVDSDVFLLKYPIELGEMLKNPKIKFAIMDEFLGQSWQHGAMQKKATKDTPFVNAGLFVQKAGYSISLELEREFSWWKNNIHPGEQTHHDEQGALAIALTEYFKNGELFIFPKEKYMLIGPKENEKIDSLEGVTLFHAVYPHHPAFYKFKEHLNKIK